jgi:hypothetical protein
VGSVVDLLFVSGALGGALLVAVTAALDAAEAPAPAADAPAAGDDPAPVTRGADEDAG